MTDLFEAVVLVVDPNCEQALAHLETMIRDVAAGGRDEDAGPLRAIAQRLTEWRDR